MTALTDIIVAIDEVAVADEIAAYARSTLTPEQETPMPDSLSPTDKERTDQLRAQALSLATTNAESSEPPESTVKRADAFYRFLSGDDGQAGGGVS